MKHVEEMTKKELKAIRLVVFDVDGVLVERGTKIEQRGSMTRLQTKKIRPRVLELIEKVRARGYLININSGRGLYMLQEMFRPLLPFVSLTYENGSASWHKGTVYQHYNSFGQLHECMTELRLLKNSKIKGFEPKEFIITVHCTQAVREIERIVARYAHLYTKWNGEAYDIGVRDKQTKARGLRLFRSAIGVSKNEVLAIGDNYNDRELLAEAGLSVTADPDRVKADFSVPLKGAKLPAELLMEQILRL